MISIMRVRGDETACWSRLTSIAQRSETRRGRAAIVLHAIARRLRDRVLTPCSNAGKPDKP
jgi:hypothetical protein